MLAHVPPWLLLVVLASSGSFAAAPPFISLSRGNLTPEMIAKHLAPRVTHMDKYRGYGAYVIPNELYPEHGLKAFRAAPDGAYLSVGTERGFVGAANASRVTHLVLIDSDEGVVLYNRTNYLLLQMAGDRADYLDLRRNASAEKWTERALKLGWSPQEVTFLQSQVDSWRYHSGAAESNFAKQHLGEKAASFSEISYCDSDVLFGRLKRMADEGKIVAIHSSLTDSAALGEIVQQLIEKKIPLSAFDASNVWWGAYINAPEFAKILNTLDRVSGPQSLLIGTDGMKVSAWAFGERYRWPYFAYTFKRIRQFGDFEAFVKSLDRFRLSPFYRMLVRHGRMMKPVPCQTAVPANLQGLFRRSLPDE